MTRKYSSISVETTLASGISNTATSMTVATGTGSALMGGVTLAAGNVDQFTVALDVDTQNEEIVFVTAVTGDTLTVVRGRAGTSAISHTGGATVKHVLTSDDLTFYTTGVATADAAVAKSVVTAKADILVGASSGVVDNLPVGTNGQVLTADSAQTLGVKWATPTAGMTNPMTNTGDTIYSSSGSTPARLGIGSTGQVLTVAGGVPSWATPAAGGGMTLLSTTAITATSAITVSSISQSYTNLLIIISGAQVPTAGESVKIRLNGNTSNYVWAYNGSTTSGGTADASIRIGGQMEANGYFSSVISIPRYSVAFSGRPISFNSRGVSTAGNAEVQYGAAGHTSDAAITSFTLTNDGATNFAATGNIFIYGVN